MEKTAYDAESERLILSLQKYARPPSQEWSAAGTGQMQYRNLHGTDPTVQKSLCISGPRTEVDVINLFMSSSKVSSAYLPVMRLELSKALVRYLK